MEVPHPKDKQITGAYVRVFRGGRVRNLEINELTDDELHVFFNGMHDRDRQKWAVFLAGWIRDNVKNE